MKLMLISNAPEIARFAVDAGVNTIFVDLEQLGKIERQGRWSTVKSDHTISDISAVRAAVGTAEVLVRTNPLHDGSAAEIDAAIAAGADCLMLPMFTSADEVARYRDLVAGRAHVRPLIETPAALNDHEALAKLSGIGSYHFGLNDLHIAYGNTFIFEPLVDGKLDDAIASFRAVGRPFGIGGVAQSGEGVVSGDMVLEEYIRRGASAVILSRTFHREATTIEQLKKRVDFDAEIIALRRVCTSMATRNERDRNNGQAAFEAAVRRSAVTLRSKDAALA